MPLDPLALALTPRRTCRSCGGPLAPVLSLGPTYLSDFPRSAGTKGHPPVPLDLMRCLASTCGLVQLAHTTPPEWMFRLYWYRSGVNEAMAAELKDIVAQAITRVDLPPHAVVVDIGANDGTLLQQYPALGCAKLLRVGWEPATNLYEVLRPHANVLYPTFFHAVEPWPTTSKARIVTAIAMFYDLDDPHAFLDGITKILHPEGVCVVQQAYLPAMLASTAFDNCCHEHLGYYDLRSMDALLAPHGLEVVDVDLRTINGGSFRCSIQFTGVRPPDSKVAALRAQEAAFFADPDQVYTAFARRVQAVKTQIHATLGAYDAMGAAVDLYAASTKSNTLLQYCGIDARMVRQAWERSPEKWGRYVGVSAIPIVSEADGRADPPAALLIGAYQFREQFLAREGEYLSKGGRMIFPLPYVESVEVSR